MDYGIDALWVSEFVTSEGLPAETSLFNAVERMHRWCFTANARFRKPALQMGVS